MTWRVCAPFSVLKKNAIDIKRELKGFQLIRGIPSWKPYGWAQVISSSRIPKREWVMSSSKNPPKVSVVCASVHSTAYNNLYRNTEETLNSGTLWMNGCQVELEKNLLSGWKGQRKMWFPELGACGRREVLLHSHDLQFCLRISRFPNKTY